MLKVIAKVLLRTVLVVYFALPLLSKPLLKRSTVNKTSHAWSYYKLYF